MLHFKIGLEKPNYDEKHEKELQLTAFSSTYRNGRDGTVIEPVRKETEIKIPINNKGPLEPDGRVWFEMIAASPNYESRDCYQRAGAGDILIQDIATQVRKTGGYSGKVVLEQNQLPTPVYDEYGKQVSEEPLYRGTLRVKLLNPEVLHGVSFASVEKYHYLPQNMKHIEASFNKWIDDALLPSQQFQPVGDNLNQINYPVHVDCVIGPGDMYPALTSTETIKNVDERYYLNLARIALKRNGVSEDWFIKTGKAAIADKTHPDRKLVEAIAANFATVYTDALPYRADESWISHRDRTGRPVSKKIDTESFGYASIQNALDCEDGAKEIYEHLRVMQNANFSRDAHVLRIAQNLLKDHVRVMVLTSVTGAKLEAPSGESIKINSSLYQNAPVGAHMYCKLVPKEHFEQLVGRISTSTGKKIAAAFNSNSRNGSNPISKSKSESGSGNGNGSGFEPKPESNTEPTVHNLEGTGPLFSLPLPIGTYYEKADPNLMKERVAHHRHYMRAYDIAASKDSVWGLGKSQQHPQRPFDEVGDSVSEFYRTDAVWWSDQPYEESNGQVNALRFLPVSLEYSGRGEKEMLCGFNVRNVSLGGKPALDNNRDDKSRWESIGLLPSGRFTPEQMKYVQSINKHTPVHKTGALDPEFVAAAQNARWKGVSLISSSGSTGFADADANPSTKEIVDDFQRNADKITKGRLEKVSPDRHHTIYKSFIGSDFMVGALSSSAQNSKEESSLRQVLLDDIKRNPNILNVQVEFVPISGRKGDYLHNTTFCVDAYLTVALDAQQQQPSSKKIGGYGFDAFRQWNDNKMEETEETEEKIFIAGSFAQLSEEYRVVDIGLPSLSLPYGLRDSIKRYTKKLADEGKTGEELWKTIVILVGPLVEKQIETHFAKKASDLLDLFIYFIFKLLQRTVKDDKYTKKYIFGKLFKQVLEPPKQPEQLEQLEPSEEREKNIGLLPKYFSGEDRLIENLVGKADSYYSKKTVAADPRFEIDRYMLKEMNKTVDALSERQKIVLAYTTAIILSIIATNPILTGKKSHRTVVNQNMDDLEQFLQ